MADTAFFRCAGGSILLMDVPDAPAEDAPASDAYSRFMLQVGKGELVRLDEDTVEAVEVDGATQYRVKAVEGEPSDDIEKMKKPQLVERLDALGLDTDGTVAELRERLVRYETNTQTDELDGDE